MSFPTEPNSTSPSQQGDLFWLACRFVEDELSTEELQAFEEQLAVDQAAREAVAAAMELHAAAHAAMSHPVPALAEQQSPRVPVRREGPGWKLLAEVLAIVAAGLLLMVLNQSFSKPRPDHPKNVVDSSPNSKSVVEDGHLNEDAQLAVLWARQLEEPSEPLSVVAIEPSEDDSTWDVGQQDARNAESSGWMWAALSVEVDENDADLQLDHEEGSL